MFALFHPATGVCPQSNAARQHGPIMHILGAETSIRSDPQAHASQEAPPSRPKSTVGGAYFPSYEYEYIMPEHILRIAAEVVHFHGPLGTYVLAYRALIYKKKQVPGDCGTLSATHLLNGDMEPPTCCLSAPMINGHDDLCIY